MLLSAFFLYLQGKPGFEGIVVLLQSGFGHVYSLEDTLLKAIPIFLCALGVAICFRMRIWNIGAEGQYIMGGIGATAVVLLFPDAPAWCLLPAMFCGAMLGGMLWAFIPGFLRVFAGMNEIISSLMLNYIALIILQQLVFGPWKDPNGGGFPYSIMFPSAASLGTIVGRIHFGLILCFVCVILLSLFFKKTCLGFEITVSGENPQAAKYAGIPYKFLLVFVFVVCGALVGLAGGVELSAVLGRLSTTLSVGYGYAAIVVAWVAKLRSWAICLFSILLAGLRVGVEGLQIEYGVSSHFAGVIEGLLLLLVLIFQSFYTYKISFIRSAQFESAETGIDS